MKRLIALFLVISFLGLNCAKHELGEGISLEPGQKPGAKLVVQKKDGQKVKGELITVKQNSLLLKESESGEDVTAGVDDIKMITIVKESKTLTGVGLGFLAGATVGAIIGYVVDEAIGKGDLIWGPEHSALLGGAIGGLVGGISGGIIGANRSKTIQIEGKSSMEIKGILEDLRKKARVPDFK
jgi:hypothetical protein